MTSVGVVGLGYWGPNLARNFDRLPDTEVSWLCDSSEQALERWGAAFPAARTTTSLDELLDDDSLDAVAVATPVPDPRRAGHARAGCRQALLRGEAAGEVGARGRGGGGGRPRRRARPHGRATCSSTTRASSGSSELIESGELGELRYIYSNRLNLGKHRQDENALWSLGAHDISVILRLAGEEPYECTAVGESYVKPGVEDVVFASCASPPG